MIWSFNFRDLYDWEMGTGLTGGLVSDEEMALLHRFGNAREFEMIGEQVFTVEWEKGERFETGADVSGEGVRRPRRGRNR